MRLIAMEKVMTCDTRALVGDKRREETDHMFQSLRVADVAVGSGRTDVAEDDVTGLAEQEFLLDVGRAFGDDFAPLARHQVQQLVHEERGWQSDDTSARQWNRLPANGTSERTRLPDSGQRGDFLQTGPAHSVGAVQQFGVVFAGIVCAEAGTAGQEALSEVLVVDGHRLHQSRRRHSDFARQRL